MPASTMMGRSISSIRIWMKSFVASPLFDPMGAPSWHDRCGTGAHQIARDIQIGIHVGKHDEPFVREHFGGLDGFVVVGQKDTSNHA